MKQYKDDERKPMRARNFAFALAAILGTGIIVSCSDSSSSGGGGGGVVAAESFPSHSGTLQLNFDNNLAYGINRTRSGAVGAGEIGSLSIVRVRNNNADDGTVLSESDVGRDPRSVSVSRDGTRAYVSNGADNTVSAFSVNVTTGAATLLGTLNVGSEPRGTALSPSGRLLFVSNYSDGTVSVIDTQQLIQVAVITLATGNQTIDHPFALACTDNGLGGDDDETLYVSEFLGKAADGVARNRVEGFDDGKEGRIGVVALRDLTMSQLIRIPALADSGFTADRSAFGPGAVSNTFQSTAADPTMDPQGAYFSQVHSLRIDGNSLFATSISLQPAPPVRFNVNAQPVIAQINIANGTFVRSTNLNNLIKSETQPSAPFTAGNANRNDRLFQGDTVAMAIRGSTGLFLSRANSVVLRTQLDNDRNISLSMRDADGAVRFETGNIPTGLVISRDGLRAYAMGGHGELTRIDLTGNVTIGAEVTTAQSPAATNDRQRELGRLAFFTGQGLPAQVLGNTDPKSIDVHRFRNMASDNGWSSCASCHPDGLSDGATWIFPTGPRQARNLDGLFAPGSGILSAAGTDQGLCNYNAVRGSVTDFNNNARGVQGGHGFTPQALAAIDANMPNTAVTDSGLVENQGPRLGVSNALDFMTQWFAEGIRPLNRPSNLNSVDVAAGRTVFQNNCASCHGGPRWNSARRLLDDLTNWPDPLFVGGVNVSPNPARFFPGGNTFALGAFDRNNTAGDGPTTNGNNDAEFIIAQRDVGTFLAPANGNIEIRGAGGAIGTAPPGLAVSFHPPSLFSVHATAPYGHDGSAFTLEEVFVARPNGLGHSTFGLTAAELRQVIAFTRSIDLNTPSFP